LRFSLERFSDVYLLTRAIAAHVQSAASSGRVSFALAADEQRLDLTIGPLRAGASRELESLAASDRPEADVARLADELVCEQIDGSELLRVVVKDCESAARHPA